MGIEFPVQKQEKSSPNKLINSISKPETLSIDNKDSNYEKAIIGTWGYQEVTPEGAVLDGTTTYAPNGQTTSVGTISYQQQNFPIVASGTWLIKEGYLHSTVKSSNVPMLLPIGFSSSDKIITITNRELRYISDGETTVEFRVR